MKAISQTHPSIEQIIGVDIGDKISHVCVRDYESGEIIDETTIGTDQDAFRRWFEPRPAALVAIEVGAHSPWISEALGELGHYALVANPRKVALINSNPVKTDALDARRLSALARFDPAELNPIVHRGRRARLDLSVARARAAAVQARTALVNTVRGMVKSFGLRLAKISTAAFPAKAARELPDDVKATVEPLLGAIADLNAVIKRYDRDILELCERYPETERFRQINGVGHLTALVFALVIEDPERFSKSRAVGGYLGLTTRVRQSGDRDRRGRVTKLGDELLRVLLVNCAHHILGHFGRDCDLRRWGVKLERRGGPYAKPKAVVAVARKLAVLLHRLWVSGEDYRRFRDPADDPSLPAVA